MRQADAVSRAVARHQTLRLLTNRAVQLAYRLPPRGHHTCPICDFRGRFAPVIEPTGARPHARCPRCGALERHRLQAVAFRHVETAMAGRSGLRILHVAPEPAMARLLTSLAAGTGGTYVTADIEPPRHGLRVDLRDMSEFDDDSWDLVWASHVFEHIDRDRQAMLEVRRVLAPSGVAVLPVPIVADQTVEYAAPSPFEHGHVRAPGLDYLDRYRDVFREVRLVTSEHTPPTYQTWIFEDRSVFPTEEMPERPSQVGGRHLDVVPLCFS